MATEGAVVPRLPSAVVGEGRSTVVTMTRRLQSKQVLELDLVLGLLVEKVLELQGMLKLVFQGGGQKISSFFLPI